MSSTGTGWEEEQINNAFGCAGIIIISASIVFFFWAFYSLLNDLHKKSEEFNKYAQTCTKEIKIATEAGHWNHGMFRQPKWIPDTEVTYKICGDDWFTKEVISRKLLE